MGFSTVVGSRGSTDLARDARGFAVKFYSQDEEGVIISRDALDGKVASEFIKALAQHRHWSREPKDLVPRQAVARSAKRHGLVPGNITGQR